MNKFFYLKSMFVVLTLLCCFSCSDDDDNEVAPLSLQEMAGPYTGSFDFTPSPSDLNASPSAKSGVAVSFDITNGTLHFSNFPASTLVEALLGEENAAALVAMLGTIAYDVPIQQLTADANSLSAKLDPPVLSINVGDMLQVSITIESPNETRFQKDGSLSFTLRTTLCQLGPDSSPFPLVNQLDFKAKRN